jgi:hypothetical protein
MTKALGPELHRRFIGMLYMNYLDNYAEESMPTVKTAAVVEIMAANQDFFAGLASKTVAAVVTGLLNPPQQVQTALVEKAVAQKSEECPKTVCPVENGYDKAMNFLAGMVTGVGGLKAKDYCCGHRRRPVRDVKVQSQSTYLVEQERFKYLGHRFQDVDVGEVREQDHVSSRWSACKRRVRRAYKED